MTLLTIERDVVLKRMEGIEAELSELNKIAKQDINQFSEGDGWKLAQFHMHRALEGVFNISSHILSRIPGGTATQYREIALNLGEYKIVPEDFAKTKLVQMAKYRNRLVHFYADITSKELHDILKNDLNDVEVFLKYIKKVLETPKKFNLIVE